MFLSPLRLISWLLGLLIIGVPLAALGFFLLAVLGNPGSCEAEGRPISYEPARAISFQQKWDQLNGALNAGQLSTVVFDEEEVTARSRLWVDEHEVPVSELFVCFHADGGAASGKVDIPFFPGDVDVLVRGTVDLRGERPEVTIEEIEMGALPGPLADVVKTTIESLIDDQTEELELRHDYGVAFADGEVTISGQPELR